MEPSSISPPHFRPAAEGNGAGPLSHRAFSYMAAAPLQSAPVAASCRGASGYVRLSSASPAAAAATTTTTATAAVAANSPAAARASSTGSLSRVASGVTRAVSTSGGLSQGGPQIVVPATASQAVATV